MRPWLLLLATLGGCVDGHRLATTLPHVRGTLRTGEPLALDREIAIGTTVSTGASDQQETGFQIPRVAVNGAFRRRVNETVDVGVLFDYGLGVATQRLGDEPLPSNRHVFGGGLTIHHSAPTPSPAIRIGLDFEVLLYVIPYVDYRWNAGPQLIDRGLGVMPSFSLGVTPSFRHGRVVISPGLTFRGQPAATGSTESYDVDEADQRLLLGRGTLVASLAIDAAISGPAHVALQIHQPVWNSPTGNFPTLGLTVAFPF